MTETLLNEELGLPDFLVRRCLPDEYVGRRYLDDEEVTLLSFLDNHGRISSTSSLMEFMLLMTRIDKMDHRILCVEILQNLLEPQQQKEFVSFGGYRLLKRWIKTAEDEDFVDELRLLVKLCLHLPFDSNAAKHSEIGKSIKKLQKHQSKTGHEVSGLYSDVQHLMDHWKEMVHQAAVLRQQQQQQQIDEERKVHEKQRVDEPQQTQDESSVANIRNISIEDKDNGVHEAKAPEAMEVEEAPAKRSPSPIPSLIPHAMEVETRTPEVLPSTPSFQFKSGTSLRDRKPLDMLEGARKLLAMRQQETTIEPSTDVPAANTEKSVLQQKPMSKGGLKKKDSNGKREKLGVKWADEEGGLLREVQTIEVEKIKSSVATYKTHKDLVKKEKQLEKEVHLLKTESAMHKTTDWKIPKPLSLSLEILDNIGVPTGSIEKDRQDKRLAHVLEVRYLDESLIPNDPDEDPNMYDIPLPDTLSTAATLPNDSVIQPIPWYIAGSIEEEEEMAQSISSQQYNLSSSGYGGNQNLLSNSVSSSLQAPAFDEYSFNTLLNSLPIGIQMLDPVTLQMIAQNPQILSTLLTPDGQHVDEANLMTLQNSTSIEEYYAAILPSSSIATSSSYPYDYSTTSQNWQRQGGLSGSTGIGNIADSYQSWQSTSNSIEDNLQLFMNSTTTSYGAGSIQIPPSRELFASLGLANASAAARTAAKYPTTKASTPCRFFNTPKGCINGDKCPFGHFLDTATSSIASSRSGPGHRPVGPGSRPIRAGDTASASAVTGNLLAARGGMKRSRK